MGFNNMRVKFSERRRASGSSTPLFVGDDWYDPFKPSAGSNRSHNKLNMRYKIQFGVPSGVKLEPSFDFIQLELLLKVLAVTRLEDYASWAVYVGSRTRMLFSFSTCH